MIGVLTVLTDHGIMPNPCQCPLLLRGNPSPSMCAIVLFRISANRSPYRTKNQSLWREDCTFILFCSIKTDCRVAIDARQTEADRSARLKVFGYLRNRQSARFSKPTLMVNMNREQESGSCMLVFLQSSEGCQNAAGFLRQRPDGNRHRMMQGGTAITRVWIRSTSHSDKIGVEIL